MGQQFSNIAASVFASKTKCTSASRLASSSLIELRVARCLLPFAFYLGTSHITEIGTTIIKLKAVPQNNVLLILLYINLIKQPIYTVILHIINIFYVSVIPMNEKNQSNIV